MIRFMTFRRFRISVPGLFALAVLLPLQVQAQTTLVSNVGQNALPRSISDLNAFDQAQSFTTGGNASGYTLTSVEIHLNSGEPASEFIVSVWTDNGSDRPGSLVVSLSPPAAIANNDLNAFTTGGIDLDANTTYFVVVDGFAAISSFVSNTRSLAEDAGAAPGWSIGDHSLHRNHRSSLASWEPFDRIKRIQVNGITKTTPDTPTTPPTELTPDPPQYLRATPDNSEATLTWDAPFYSGGAEITGYAYRHRQSNQIFGATAPADWNDVPGEASARSHTVTDLANEVEYTFEVRAENEHGGGTPARATVRLPAVVSAESEEIPTELALMGNYPNPFNPQTAIDYALPQTSHVRLAVYDMTGRTIAVLMDGVQPQGRHTARFNADGLPTGTYVYRLTAGAETLTQTMTLVR